MTLVRKIPNQYNSLILTLKIEEYTTDMKLNPILDANGDYIISEEEFQQMNQTIKNKYSFIGNLEQIIYNPVPLVSDALGIPIGP